MPKTTKQPDFVNDTAVKDFTWKDQKMKSTDAAIEELGKRFNAAIKDVIVEAVKLAQKAKQKTIMPAQIVEAFDKHVGKKDLNWEEILAQIIAEAPADMGKIAQGIRDWIKQHEKAKAGKAAK